MFSFFIFLNWKNKKFFFFIAYFTMLEWQILKGTHFKTSVKGHLRTLHTKEWLAWNIDPQRVYVWNKGHQGQVRGHQRPLPLWPSVNLSPVTLPDRETADITKYTVWDVLFLHIYPVQSEEEIVALFMKIDSSSVGQIGWVSINVPFHLYLRLICRYPLSPFLFLHRQKE